jgi:VanZ family protein
MRILGLKYSLQSDMLFHAGYYFCATLLMFFFLKLKKLGPLFLFFLFLLPTIFEFFQQFIPGRTFSIYDLLANFAGLIAALGVYFGIKYFQKG